MGKYDKDVQSRIKKLRDNGASISWHTAVAVARSIIEVKDHANLHRYNFSEPWARSLFIRMNLSHRAVTTGKLTMPDSLISEVKMSFTRDIAKLVTDNQIPDDMVINFDQTPIQYCPSSRYTMAPKGSSKISINGAADKRSLTALVAVTMGGGILPFQLIYKGLTERSLPKSQYYPDSFHVLANQNHWSNEETMLDFADKILKPYINSKREVHGQDKPCLLIFDQFKAHLTQSFTEKVQELNGRVVMVPPNMTDYLQPLDLSFNKSLKNFVTNEYNLWYSEKVAHIDPDKPESHKQLCDVIKSGVEMRDLSGVWLTKAYEHYQLPAQRDIIVNGFKAAGILDHCVSGPIEDDPFADLVTSEC